MEKNHEIAGITLGMPKVLYNSSQSKETWQFS